MIKVIIPPNPDFKLYKTELKKLYKESQKRLCDPNDFDFVTKNTLFYGFVDQKELIGGIYFFKENEKLFMNGFAGRKHFDKNIECVKMSLNWFNCDIYAEAQNKASAISLLKSGFKRKEGKLFVYKQWENPGKD